MLDVCSQTHALLISSLCCSMQSELARERQVGGGSGRIVKVSLTHPLNFTHSLSCCCLSLSLSSPLLSLSSLSLPPSLPPPL